MYKETGTQDKVESALKVLDDSSGRTVLEFALFQTLLKHRLSMLNYIFLFLLPVPLIIFVS